MCLCICVCIELWHFLVVFNAYLNIIIYRMNKTRRDWILLWLVCRSSLKNGFSPPSLELSNCFPSVSHCWSCFELNNDFLCLAVCSSHASSVFESSCRRGRGQQTMSRRQRSVAHQKFLYFSACHQYLMIFGDSEPNIIRMHFYIII